MNDTTNAIIAEIKIIKSEDNLKKTANPNTTQTAFISVAPLFNTKSNNGDLSVKVNEKTATALKQLEVGDRLFVSLKSNQKTKPNATTMTDAAPF